MMKKWIAIIACLTVCIATFSTMSFAVTDTDVFPMGDVNGDRCVNAVDALLVLKHAVGKINLTPEQIERADVSSVVVLQPDGEADAFDALLILQYAGSTGPFRLTFPGWKR